MGKLNIEMDQYVEHELPSRFSDYGFDGGLQVSKVCMYFEYSRFEIAKDVKLFEYFYEMDSQDEVFYPVIEMECEYIKPIYTDTELVIQTTLVPPVLPRLDFAQRLVDKKSGEVLVCAKVKVAIVTTKQGMMLSINDNLKRCITSYLESIK